MTTETISTSASTENRLAARLWVEAFNARDDAGEAGARTADYIGPRLLPRLMTAPLIKLSKKWRR